MASKEELEALDRLLSRQERTIRNAFMAFVAEIQTQPVIDAIMAELRQGKIARAISIMDSYVERLSLSLGHVIDDVGGFTAAELSAIVPGAISAIYFDPSHPRAAALIRQNKLKFVREFTNEQRRATRNAIERAFQRGTGTVGMGRAFRDSIGLTQFQERAIDNYEKLLRAGSRDALRRVLRDRRFDASVARAAGGGRALTESQIVRMVAAYRSRYLQSRAETIARTEALEATSIAREESVLQMVDQTGIDPARVERTWNRTRDKRTREWHNTMQGQIRAIGQKFIDGLGNLLLHPGDRSAPAETVINCRCTVTYRILPA